MRDAALSLEHPGALELDGLGPRVEESSALFLQTPADGAGLRTALGALLMVLVNPRWNLALLPAAAAGLITLVALPRVAYERP